MAVREDLLVRAFRAATARDALGVVADALDVSGGTWRDVLEAIGDHEEQVRELARDVLSHEQAMAGAARRHKEESAALQRELRDALASLQAANERAARLSVLVDTMIATYDDLAELFEEQRANGGA